MDYWSAAQRNATALLGHAQTTRRRMLALGVLFLCKPSIVWAERRRPPSPRTADTIAAVCDRFLPPQGKNPGALALGIDAHLLEVYSSARYADGKALNAVVTHLEAEGFLERDGAGQDEILQHHLDSDSSSLASQHLRRMLKTVVKRYYADPRSWAALGYRKPQPLGYPDYAKCPRGMVKHGRSG